MPGRRWLLPAGACVSIRDHFLRVKIFTQHGAQEWTQQGSRALRD
jgi:hypothetical protein